MSSDHPCISPPSLYTWLAQASQACTISMKVAVAASFSAVPTKECCRDHSCTDARRLYSRRTVARVNYLLQYLHLFSIVRLCRLQWRYCHYRISELNIAARINISSERILCVRGRGEIKGRTDPRSNMEKFIPKIFRPLWDAEFPKLRSQYRFINKKKNLFDLRNYFKNSQPMRSSCQKEADLNVSLHCFPRSAGLSLSRWVMTVRLTIGRSSFGWPFRADEERESC